MSLNLKSSFAVIEARSLSERLAFTYLSISRKRSESNSGENLLIVSVSSSYDCLVNSISLSFFSKLKSGSTEMSRP